MHVSALVLFLVSSRAGVCSESCSSDGDGTSFEDGGTPPPAPSIFEDAERFLLHLGLPPDLPSLKVQFPGAFYPVNGSTTTYEIGDKLLEHAPRVTWVPFGPTDKYMLLMFDPDAPRRVGGDGNTAGTEGPEMHWLVVNCHDDIASGYQVLGYTKPTPLYGTHRYILILFQQHAPGSLPPRFNQRRSWDLEGYLRTNEGKVQPVAMNFFYVRNSAKP